MKSAQHFLIALTIGLFVASSILTATSWLVSYPGAAPQAASMAVQAPVADPFTIDTTVVGTVELAWGATGKYDDALTPPTADELNALPDLGTLNLTLLMQKQADGAVTGYVDLTNTLVFTAHHTISTTLANTTTALAVGPEISGTYQDGKLNLLSERFENTTQAGETVERQFRLSADENQDAGLLSGEYRETVWGFGLQPLTIVGTFKLQDPDAPLTANSAPVANPQPVGAVGDTETAITLTGSDADGDGLTFTVNSPPVNGSLSGEAPNLTYTPNPCFAGSDSFTFTVDDGKGGTATAAVTIIVTGGTAVCNSIFLPLISR